MSTCTVEIRNMNLVEAVRDSDQKVMAKAYRTSPDQSWFIGRRNVSDDQFYVIGTIGQPLPELLQRKVILETLKTIC